ncbi:hypothetical protein [Leptothermofonsia sp. ETS-13]
MTSSKSDLTFPVDGQLLMVLGLVAIRSFSFHLSFFACNGMGVASMGQ